MFFLWALSWVPQMRLVFGVPFRGKFLNEDGHWMVFFEEKLFFLFFSQIVNYARNNFIPYTCAWQNKMLTCKMSTRHTFFLKLLFKTTWRKG
jgi:hypothetical protein